MSNRLNSPNVLSLGAAMAVLKAAGYRISKPKEKKKDRVGPIFVARFADGQVTRMSTFTSLANLDVERGKRLSCLAWETRWRYNMRRQAIDGVDIDCLTPDPPAILSASFEQDGKMLASYNWESIGAESVIRSKWADRPNGRGGDANPLPTHPNKPLGENHDIKNL